MDEWKYVHEIWLRQQRGETPSKDSGLKEQSYYKLIAQIEEVNPLSTQITKIQSSKNYSFRLEPRKST